MARQVVNFFNAAARKTVRQKRHADRGRPGRIISEIDDCSGISKGIFRQLGGGVKERGDNLSPLGKQHDEWTNALSRRAPRLFVDIFPTF